MQEKECTMETHKAAGRQRQINRETEPERQTDRDRNQEGRQIESVKTEEQTGRETEVRADWETNRETGK